MVCSIMMTLLGHCPLAPFRSSFLSLFPPCYRYLYRLQGFAARSFRKETHRAGALIMNKIKFGVVYSLQKNFVECMFYFLYDRP